MSDAIHDSLDPTRASALQAALGEVCTINSGSVLPPFYHQLYFWQPSPPAELGHDGHPKIGGLIPDFGLPRRMWAGGRLEFFAPLYASEAATKTTILHDAKQKQGRTGPLAFVTLKHEIFQNNTLCITEYQDLVYREAATVHELSSEPPQARTDETISEDVRFDSTLLFRYSGLTFNGHRIHFDADYARSVEGYNGLVVHGPLLAHLLMRMADQQLGGLKYFNFRATAPLTLPNPATLCWRDGQLWVRGAKGQLHMRAEAG